MMQPEVSTCEHSFVSDKTAGEVVCRRCGETRPNAEEFDPEVSNEEEVGVSPADIDRLGTNLMSELWRCRKDPNGVFESASKGKGIRRVDVRETAIARLLAKFDDREQNRPHYLQRRRVFLAAVQRYYRQAKVKSEEVLAEMTRGHKFDDPPAPSRKKFDPRLDPSQEERSWT